MEPLDWWTETTREWIVRAYSGDYNLYQGLPKGTQGDFAELLCYEIHHGSDGEHTGGLTFNWLAKKWHISVSMLGELIADHCGRLEE